MKYSIVHLSDLHFKNDVENRFRIEKLLEDLDKLPLGPNILTVFSGDLVQSGDKEQYEVLFDLLLVPLLEAKHKIAVVPGNHDIQQNLTDEAINAVFLKDHNSSYLFDGNSLVPSPFNKNPEGPLENYRIIEEYC